MIKLGRVDKILTLSLRIFNGPKAFPLFNWDMNLCTSSWLVALGRNEFNEVFLRKFLNDLLDSRMVFDKLGPIFIQKLLKALAISVGFMISLPFTLTMLGRTLLLDFSVIRWFYYDFYQKNLKYSFLGLRMEKVTLFLNF